MTSKKQDSQLSTEFQFELKYCERCGGLWLRPMGGGQTYCGSCWREMEKLPRATQPEDNPRISRRPRRGGNKEEMASYDEQEERYLDALWGAE